MSTEEETIEFCKLAIENIGGSISIKFPQYPSFHSKFSAICIEEAYEEIDILIDDVASGFDESVILEQISEEIEIKDDDKEHLCNLIHYSLTNFSPPPTSLNLADISIQVDKNEIETMKNLVQLQASSLKPYTVKDITLLKLLVIGQKNHFPLLTYLVDTYQRYRLKEYQKLYEKFNAITTTKKRTKFMAKKFEKVADIPDFFKNCYSMKNLRTKKKNNDSKAEKALEWYESSMKSFFRRLFGPLKMTPIQFNYRLNDSILIYAKYYISILTTVNNIIKNQSTKLPQQIDFWVIPKAVKQYTFGDDDDENKSDNDNDSDLNDSDLDDSDLDETKENELLNINNLTERLKNGTKNLIIQNITNETTLSRTFFQVYDSVVKGERNKRMIMIVDRRINEKDKIENKINYGNKIEENKQGDKLYGFLPIESCNIPPGRYLNEALFDLSRAQVIPGYGNYPSIHASSDLYNMCLLSIQIHEESVVRAYWYINGSAARFYVNDMINIWPLYFIEKSIDEKTGQITHQNIDQVKQLIKSKSKDLPLKDANFDKFFEENTKYKPEDGYNKPLE